MKTLIGLVTYGNLPFTKLAIRGIRETTTMPYELYVVVGKPGDNETAWWLEDEGIEHCVARENVGFPASINEIYDYAWLETPFAGGDFDYLILAGNDVIPYPGAIDGLIHVAAQTEWEWLCGSQFDAKSLVERYPETRRYFEGENLLFSDFEARPWEAHEATRQRELEGKSVFEVEPDCIKDVRNLTLFKRSVFEKLGYADANFWPGGYFEDNDYCTRAHLAGVRGCGLPAAAYFHFWSRTIHQGGKGAEHHDQFRANERFYREKWGGPFEQEKWTVPFNGVAHELTRGIVLPASLRIPHASFDSKIAEYWRGRKG